MDRTPPDTSDANAGKIPSTAGELRRMAKTLEIQRREGVGELTISKMADILIDTYGHEDAYTIARQVAGDNNYWNRVSLLIISARKAAAIEKAQREAMEGGK